MSKLIHRFVPGSDPSRYPLLLLHRTGGNENDFIDIAPQIVPGAPLLAVRGSVIEDGKARYFQRHAKGQFDVEDLALRTRDLNDFLIWSRNAYKIERPIVFGFSNGANIAWSLIISHPRALRAAVLMRPMLAFEPAPALPLDGFPILVIGGLQDTTVPHDRTHKLVEILRSAGASIELRWARGAHDFTLDDSKFATDWIAQFSTAELHSPG